MAANPATKKTNYINAVVAQAQAVKAANDALVVLAAEYANQYGAGQSLVLADADFQASGATQYMTAAEFSTFFTGFQAALAAATSSNLQGLLAILPQ